MKKMAMTNLSSSTRRKVEKMRKVSNPIPLSSRLMVFP